MKKFKFISRDKIKNFPKESGVYCFKDGKEILYIGKAANIKERVKNHFQESTYRDNLFINKAEKVGYIKTSSEIEALILEASLIKKYQPKYNIVWRDDKNYFYVGITKEDYPQVFITHQIKSPNTKYVGPFVDGSAIKQTLKILRKVFPYRTCKTLPKRPCLWYYLGRCPAPCLLKSKVIEEIPRDSLRLKREIQQNARNIMKILKEGKIGVSRDLKKEMKEASKFQDFERAAKIRDQIEALEKVLAHAKIFTPEKLINSVMANYYVWKTTEEKLRKFLEMKNRVSRIEAYDVSNIQGEVATGSMVTFINGVPEKNFYRRFKIRIAGKPDDLAMLKEILTRRFRHPEWPYPDLILVDGGRAQLNAAQECSKCHFEQIRMMALAKKENKLYIEKQKKPILLKTLPREIFNLILQLRDEAHRFAISYHKKLREKGLLGS